MSVKGMSTALEKNAAKEKEEFIETKIKIEYLKLTSIKLNPKNPRDNDLAVDDVMVSIKEFGFVNPILVDKDLMIIAGHTRFKAALKLGMKKVPCVNITHLTPAQAKAYMVADNKLNEKAKWNKDLLAELVREMPPTLSLDFLFTDGEIDKMMGVTKEEIQEQQDEMWKELNKKEEVRIEQEKIGEQVRQEELEKFANGKDEEIPEKVEPRTKLGQIYKLGEHRLMCGNSTSAAQVKKLMDGRKADMAFEDPPYNTGMTAETQAGKEFAGGGSTRLSHMFNDKFSDEDWKNLLEGFVLNTYNSLKEDSVAYICLDWRRNHELVYFIDKLFKRSNMIVWDKVVHGLGSDYKYTHELINVCKKGKPILKTNNGEQDYQDVWHIQRKIGRDEDHATKKPLELVERALKHASQIGDIVLDLFGGSGSTLIACEKLKRKCFMMELDPHYCDVIIQRFENLTGQKAELID